MKAPVTASLERESRNLSLYVRVVLEWASETTSDAAGRSALMFLLSHANCRFGYNTPFQEDERMLPIFRLMVRQHSSMSSRGTLYERLYDAGCFTTCGPFYRDWVEALLSERRFVEAAEVVSRARRAAATPTAIISNVELAIVHEDEAAGDKRERILFAIVDMRRQPSSLLADADEGSSSIKQAAAARSEAEDEDEEEEGEEASSAEEEEPDEEDDDKEDDDITTKPETFSADDLAYVLTTTKCSEILLHLHAADAAPSQLPIISSRLGAIRRLAAELDKS